MPRRRFGKEAEREPGYEVTALCFHSTVTERRNIAATSRARYRYKACGRKMGNGRMDVRFGQEEEKEGICVRCDGLTTLTLPA